jgi:hypothetical protein
MARTPPAPRTQPPTRAAVLSRIHHQQGAEHHLSRMCRYSGTMKDDLGNGELPSLEHALQVSADLARFIVHLSALKELDVARPEKAPVVAAVFKPAARRGAA